MLPVFYHFCAITESNWKLSCCASLLPHEYSFINIHNTQKAYKLNYENEFKSDAF